MAPNIYTAGAGTAADCDHVTEMVQRDLKLHRLTTGSQSRVQTAVTKFSNHLFQYGGHVGCALIIGGVDVKGPHLISISPDGHSYTNPFLCIGSGSLAAMAIMETNYKDHLTKQEAIDLVTKCVEAGIYHDLGSGSNVDYAIITKNGLEEKKRSHKSDNFKIFSKEGGFTFAKGTTKVLDTKVYPLVVADGQQPMEL